MLSRRLEGYSLRQSEAQAAVMTHRANAQRLADIWLQDLWVGRETAEFALRPGLAPLQPGDIVRLGAAGGGRLFQIQRIADGGTRQVSARAIDPSVYDTPAPRLSAPASRARHPRPAARAGARSRHRAPGARAAVLRRRLRRSLAGRPCDLEAAGGGFEAIGSIERRATIGDTLDVLRAGPVGRFDNGASVTVRLGAGQLASVDDSAALAGRTTMAIGGADGAWEIFAFARAELVGEKTYRLSRLLRGLGGEDHLAERETPAGAPVVLLDDSMVPLARDAAAIGVPTTYRIGPANRDYADPTFVQPVVSATRKALMPYAPTQARAKRTAAGVVVSFIRRGRIDADAWETLDIPLAESSEAYEIEIALPGNGRRVLNATAPSVLYPTATETRPISARRKRVSPCRSFRSVRASDAAFRSPCRFPSLEGPP